MQLNVNYLVFGINIHAVNSNITDSVHATAILSKPAIFVCALYFFGRFIHVHAKPDERLSI